MRQFRKIIGAVLVLALTVCSIASCDMMIGGKDPAKITDAADEFLSTNPYSVNMTLEYDSDDADMLTAISDLSESEMKIDVDGDKFAAKLALGEEAENYILYTFVDGVLYTEWSENGNTVQEKKEFSADKKAELLATVGTGTDIKHSDFSEVEVATRKGVSVITCNDIKAEKIADLTANLQAQLDEVFENAVVSIYNASLAIEVEDDRYNVIILTCEYFITVSESTSYSLEMTYSMKFNYEKEREIVAPSF